MSEANDTRQMQPPGFNGKNKVLLHSCCAPCSAAVMEAIKVMGVDLTVFFYNPNIHPFKEYERRKNENKRFAEKLNIPFIDADYDSTRWFEQTNGLENEPERGARCTVCFDMRLTNTAQYANAHDFPIFAASLGISRWKNLELINDCGQRAAARYPALFYWDCNWRKGGGAARMTELTKQEKFYQQEYCGCAYSLRDTNLRLAAAGRKEISPVK